MCPRKKGGGRGELELLFSKGFLFHSSGRAECGRISAVFCGRTVPFGLCVSCGAALACKDPERPGWGEEGSDSPLCDVIRRVHDTLN